MNNVQLKKYLYFSAVKDIVQLFGEQELGSCEVDIEAVADFVESWQFPAYLFNVQSNTEDVYQYVTDQILSGFPIWDLLKVSDWTRKRLENTFKTEQDAIAEQLRKTYKCFTCKYYHSTKTSLGVIEKCNYEYEKEKEKNQDSRFKHREFHLYREDEKEFHLKKRCKKYEQVE